MNGREASSKGRRLAAPELPPGARYGRVRRASPRASAAHATVGSWLSTSGVGRRAVVGAGLPRADLTAVGRARPRTGLQEAVTRRRISSWVRVGYMFSSVQRFRFAEMNSLQRMLLQAVLPHLLRASVVDAARQVHFDILLTVDPTAGAISFGFQMLCGAYCICARNAECHAHNLSRNCL